MHMPVALGKRSEYATESMGGFWEESPSDAVLLIRLNLGASVVVELVAFIRTTKTHIKTIEMEKFAIFIPSSGCLELCWKPE